MTVKKLQVSEISQGFKRNLLHEHNEIKKKANDQKGQETTVHCDCICLSNFHDEVKM